LRKGDLIVAAGGEPVRSSDDLFAAMDSAGAGPGAGAPQQTGTLRLRVVRQVDEIDVEVHLE
jgi:hypothetical protein